MALKPDQRAMLQLLLERGQSYDDLASVLGIENGEVRERARVALTELGGSDPDADVGLTDYLLGQADPIGRADAVRHLQSDPETLALAEKIAAQLQLLAPDAELPELPRAKGRRAATPRPQARPKPPVERRDRRYDRLGGLTSRLRQAWEQREPQALVIFGTVVASVLVVILGVAGVFGGDDESASSEPAAERLGIPLGPLQADKKGTVSGRIPLPPLLVDLLSRSEFLDVSATSIDEVLGEAQSALTQGFQFVTYTGTSIIRGDIAAGDVDQREISISLEGSGDASGQVRVGVDDERQTFLDVKLEGLEEPPEGEGYFLWFLLPEGTENLQLPPGSGTGAPQGGVPQPEQGAPPQPGNQPQQPQQP